MKNGLNIVSLRSYHGGEFQNESLEMFCEENGIHHNFSTLRTPQQNGVMERKNRSLEEGAITLLNETKLPKYFLVNAEHTIRYTLNRVLIIPILNKTPYELYKGRNANISHLRDFGCKCFVLNNGKDSLGKFDAKADEAIFLGYSLHSKAYIVFNRRTLSVEEFVHVVCNKTNSIFQDNSLEDEEVGFQEKDYALEDEIKAEELEQSQEILTTTPRDFPREWRTQKDLSLDNIIGEISKGVSTRSMLDQVASE